MSETTTESEQPQMDTTPGTFAWNELATSDLAGSEGFYSGLFGWTMESMPGMDYKMAMVGDRPVAGMMKPPAEKGDVPTTWISYITVEDLDATVARAQELGAHLCMPVTEIPDKGRFAGVADPQGAPIAFWEFAK